jgi:hypothetical protein
LKVTVDYFMVRHGGVYLNSPFTREVEAEKISVQGQSGQNPEILSEKQTKKQKDWGVAQVAQ